MKRVVAAEEIWRARTDDEWLGDVNKRHLQLPLILVVLRGCSSMVERRWRSRLGAAALD
jgi:hypothetical protein